MIQREALKFIRDNRDRPFFAYLPTTIPHAELLPPRDEIFAEFAGRFPERPFAGSPAGREAGSANYGPAASVSAYAPQSMPKAAYAAMVTRLDRQVGEVLRLLDELGLADSTLVLFTSDNGPHREGGNDPVFFDSNGPLRGFKRDLYEGGIRVPMLARWPGHIAPGRTSEFAGAVLGYHAHPG